MTRTLQILTRDDQQRRVRIYQRADGLFGFCEEAWEQTYNDGFWYPVAGTNPICDTLEIAEREATGRIAWLSNSN